MITHLIMSAKMATPGLLKIKVFRNKGYDVMTNEILSRDSNYIIDLAMLPKFGNSSISITKFIITNFIRI